MGSAYINSYASQEPAISVVPVGKLSFDEFVIPPYQRPYKWTAKNVNQLINDLIAFRERMQYRLGTLVLYQNEIVDGQQRIITLSLLLKVVAENVLDDRQRCLYKDCLDKLDVFFNATGFSNRYSLHNVVENIRIIENRIVDFDKKLFDFVLSKCEFVVVRVNDISEAFQFFDSQNARGKDLEPHDLLKAYHLREIKTLSDEDTRNIDTWQELSTDFLKNVFLDMFRAKKWSKGKYAWYFTKNDVDTFKGVSIDDAKRYPFYQMEIIAPIFLDRYNNDLIRQIDQKKMEYPFNLDDQIVNGSRFFDMICHYVGLYNQVRSLRLCLPEGRAKEIMELISGYNGSWRTGDEYVKRLFYTLLLYYVDKFGFEELDKVVPQFFVWAYSVRLQNFAVQRATIDNCASDNGSMFRCVNDAKTPYDIINYALPTIAEKRCSKCEEIESMFL